MKTTTKSIRHDLEALKSRRGRPSDHYEVCKTCPTCKEFTDDIVDRMIYHDNGHVWPGFAGEPSSGNYGGSDF